MSYTDTIQHNPIKKGHLKALAGCRCPREPWSEGLDRRAAAAGPLARHVKRRSLEFVCRCVYTNVKTECYAKNECKNM